MPRPPSKPTRFFFVLFPVLAAFSAPGHALMPLITDDTDTQGKGRHQIEIAHEWNRTRQGGDSKRENLVPLTYTYGLTETIDIFGDVGYSRIRSSDHQASGFGNTIIGLKWRFFESEATGTSLALKPEIAIPVTSRREEKGLGNGKISGNLALILSQKMPFGAVHFNAGLGHDRHRNRYAVDNTKIRHFSVAPVWNVTEKWKLALDVGIDLSRCNGDTVRTKFGEIAAIYAPTENIDLAIGVIRSIDDQSPKSKTRSVITGMTFRF